MINPASLTDWVFRCLAADRTLITAVFEPDAASALQAASTWLKHTPDEHILYRHHRPLGAVSRRFGANPALAQSRKMLRNIEQQLWIRAVASVAEMSVTLDRFDQMHVPYFLHGNILWHLDGAPIFRDLETVEVTVPEEALGFALGQLWSRGWLPGPGVAVLFAPDPVDLVRKGFSRIRLRTDRWLLPANSQLKRQSIWDRAVRQDMFGHSLRFPDKVDWPKLVTLAKVGNAHELQAKIDAVEFRRRAG